MTSNNEHWTVKIVIPRKKDWSCKLKTKSCKRFPHNIYPDQKLVLKAVTKIILTATKC